ncbi:hypothetical protein Taro_024049 [Colocasia esculenta]|uniref:Uncharacterized protein n=1 Tax=Colocasia esculenta TaxID=4460 RepID=A0A843V5S3_COLES|nr:hypothetical protein [Colocasia esculenta]
MASPSCCSVENVGGCPLEGRGLPSELLRVPQLVKVFPPRGILHLHDLLPLAQFLDVLGHVVHFLDGLWGNLSHLAPDEVIFEGPML